MEKLIELIPQIGTVFSLVAFLFAGYFFLQRNKLQHDIDIIKALPEGERANLIEKTFEHYKIPEGKDDLPSDQKFDLLKSQINIKKLKLILTFAFGVGMILLVAYQIAKSNPPSPGEVPNPNENGQSTMCSQWKSNLDIIESTYQSLGTGEKTYVNRERTIQKLENLEFDPNSVLEKDKNELISLLRTAPEYSDPNWNAEFTMEAKLLRDQLKMEIQKKVNKCG